MTIRVGLIGRGVAGTVYHAPLIKAVAELDLAGVAGYGDAAGLIADPAIDLIVVATPNLTHFPLARAALEAGKHVVVEKPFAISVAEADALIALANQRGKVLCVFHNRRWDGDFLTVRALVESGRLGEIMLFEAHWDRFRRAIQEGWREVAAEGAGLLADLGPHMIDQMLLLFGSPDAIEADITAQRGDAAVDDYWSLTFHYGCRRAVLSASTLAAAPRPRFALHGTGASFVKYGLDTQEAALRGGRGPGDTGFGQSSDDGMLTLADGSNAKIATARGAYASFYTGLAAAIRDGGPPPVDPADAREGLRLIALARQSAEEGRRIGCRDTG
ncbi:MAG TPA: Gfo/Idh/MocA family oxidoreductase [Allosphingosinicella sp.]|jgi:scyllo-inositol 2-dehydrogenase (NADP+)